MATDISPPTADSVPSGDGVSSPHSLRRSLPSPWASIVRGDSEKNSSPAASATAAATATGGASGPSSSPPVDQTPASDNSVTESSGSELQPESSDVNGEGNASGVPRRPVWNRPLNGVVEPTSVMGWTASWPALSEVRAVTRSPVDTPRPVSDGSAASSQAPLISQPPQRPAINNAHGNSTGNNSMSGRPRLRNRGGGGSSSGSGPSQNTFNQPAGPAPPMPPPFPVFEVPYPMILAVVDNSVRGARPIGGVGASHSHTGNDHSSQRNNSRRGGYGPRPRGDGAYHNNHGGRRDQDRRDVHPPPPPPQYMPPPMGCMSPPSLPSGAAPYMAPPPMRVYPGPQMGFDMTSPFIYVPPMAPESFMPMVPSHAPMIFPPANENPLTSMIVKQIDFYFSDDNLVKDSFLRSNMDDHGWVPVSLIYIFRRVHQLTKDIPLILDSLRHSTVVEVQGDKIRRRSEWSKWLLSSSGSRTPSSPPENALTTSLREVSLDDATNSQGNVDAKEDQHLSLDTDFARMVADNPRLKRKIAIERQQREVARKGRVPTDGVAPTDEPPIQIVSTSGEGSYRSGKRPVGEITVAEHPATTLSPGRDVVVALPSPGGKVIEVGRADAPRPKKKHRVEQTERDPADRTLAGWDPARTDEVHKDARPRGEYVRDYLRSRDPVHIKHQPVHIADATLDVGRSWTLDLEEEATKQDWSDNMVAAIVHSSRTAAFLSRSHEQVKSMVDRHNDYRRKHSKILKVVQDKAASLEHKFEAAEKEKADLLAVVDGLKKAEAEKTTAFETLDADFKKLTTEMSTLKAEKDKLAEGAVDKDARIGEMTAKIAANEKEADADAIYAYIDAFGGAMRSLRLAKIGEAFLTLKAELEAYIVDHPLPGMPLPVGDLGLALPADILIEKDEAVETEDGDPEVDNTAAVERHDDAQD
ncbi:hypothetical protein ACS0TY_036591 [Phlomoides rotata]